MKYNKFAYCTVKHTRDTGGVVRYFIDNCEHFYLYIYPSSYANEPSIFQRFERGILRESKKCFYYHGKNKGIITLFYLINLFKFIKMFKIRRTHIIVNNPFLLPFSGLSDWCSKNITIFWIWDYFPSKAGMMKLYHLLANWYSKNPKRVLFLSKNLKEIYLPKALDEAVVTFGIINKKIKRNPKKNVAGFLGSIKPGSGIENIINVMVIDKELILEVVGDGVTKKNVEEYALDKGVLNRITFYGFVDDFELEKIIANWSIGFALYDDSPESITNFTDPSKAKFYIENEIPVIMSKISYFQKQLTEFSAGVTSDLKARDISTAINEIRNNYKKYSDGATRLKKELEFVKKYDKNFECFRKN